MSEVRLTVAEFVDILYPPPHVTTMEEYKEHIRRVFRTSEHVAEAKRSPGRPLKNIHPAYNEREWKAITEMVKSVIREDKGFWSHEGTGMCARGPAKVQPDEETDIFLDNGVIMRFATRIDVNEDGVATSLFPPVASQ